MPSLIDIRRRVKAVKSTQQITKAMKMVSSSKLRRAQERIVKSRPYAKEMLRVFNNLATRTENSAHPLLNDDPLAARTLLIVITADRGLAGSFNTNVAKAALQFTLEQPKSPDGKDVAMALVGRKGRDFFMRRGFDVLYEEVGLFQNVKWSHAQAIAQTAIKEFLGPDISSVYLVYNEFRSVISQRVVVDQLLPIGRAEVEAGAQAPAPGEAQVDYLYEPSPQEIFNQLLPRYIEVQIYQAILETAASFFSAQMVAMRNATDNANELIGDLTLVYNKTRQATITREMIEIASGAEALG